MYFDVGWIIPEGLKNGRIQIYSESPLSFIYNGIKELKGWPSIKIVADGLVFLRNLHEEWENE